MALVCIYGYRECDGCMACEEEPKEKYPYGDWDDAYDRYMDGVIMDG